MSSEPITMTCGETIDMVKQALRVAKLYAALIVVFAVFVLLGLGLVAWMVASIVLSALALSAGLHDPAVLPLAILGIISAIYCAVGTIRFSPMVLKAAHLLFVGTRLLQPHTVN